MKKRIKFIFSLLFVFMFAMQLAVGALAEAQKTDAEESGQVRFSNISSYDCSCYISGITLYASASLTAKRSMPLSITMELQKLSGGSYSPIKTWSGSKTGTSLVISGSKTINVFATYRIKATFSAGGETVTAYAYP